MSKTEICAYCNALNATLFTIHPVLNPSETVVAFRLLCELLNDTETDESTWSMGECGECSLDSLIVGAYYYFSDYHGGQSTEEYATLSALGSIFGFPGRSGLDDDSPEKAVYEQLETFLAPIHSGKGN